MDKIKVNSIIPYEIIIENNLLNQIDQVIKDKNIVVIYDKNVTHLKEKLNTRLNFKSLALDCNEDNKSFNSYFLVINFFIESKVTRKDTIIIALGGGIITDLVGFCCATFNRGLKFISIPTTLLAMVDASIGSKNGVNYQGTKNLIGSFYDPSLVIIDPLVLDTLDKRHFNNGMAEVIKMGLIYDASILNDLNQDYDIKEIIIKSLLGKKHFVENDYFDQGIRQYLNFGHTYGHALESFYHFEKYLHGEAVAIGMYYQYPKPELKDLLLKFNLPFEDQIKPEHLNEYLLSDKKNTQNKIVFVKLKHLNQPYLEEYYHV